jgi:hypothetical protein
MGFEIMSRRRVDQFLDQRDAERKEEYRRWLAGLRKSETAGDEHNAGRNDRSDVGPTIAVSLNELTAMASRKLLPADVVLDIGCGIHPQPYVDAPIHICCEPCEEYLHRLSVERGGDRKHVFLRAGLTEAVRLFPARSVDSIFMLDVIEHLDRPEALSGLKGVLRIARKQVIVFTPLGFMAQDPVVVGVDPWGMSGEEWHRHKSGWTPSDFRYEEGWDVMVCKDVFRNDAYGRPLSNPIGAMWAIWETGNAARVPAI